MSMPKNRVQSVVLTMISAFMMVYPMTIYNMALVNGGLTNGLFLTAIRNMWPEYVVIALCAFFISSPIALHLAFRFVKPTDRPIVITVAIQIFMIICQVAFGSLLGVWHNHGFGSQFVSHYITAYCRNFQLAFPLQIFLAGPISRRLFSLIFSEKRAVTAKTA